MARMRVMNGLTHAARFALLIVSLLPLTRVALSAEGGEPAPKEGPPNPIFAELRKTLRPANQRSRSALAHLAYAEQCESELKPERARIKTTDAHRAEVVMIEVLAKSIPGDDLSMAFLLVDKQVVDWASCWTHNRTANQKLLLEDVDGDGFVDVAFRAEQGWAGLQDERQNRRPGDARIWLAAYSVSSKGLKPIFPVKERVHCVKPWFHTGNLPLQLHVEGLPHSLAESEMCECTVSLKNSSQSIVELAPGWYFPDILSAGSHTSLRWSERTAKEIKPGETVSATVLLRLTGTEDSITLEWNVAPRPGQ